MKKFLFSFEQEEYKKYTESTLTYLQKFYRDKYAKVVVLNPGITVQCIDVEVNHKKVNRNV